MILVPLNDLLKAGSRYTISNLLQLFVLTSVILFVSLPVDANSSEIAREHKIKASYVFNFIRFIKWPDQKLNQTDQPIVVCSIQQTDDFSKAFNPVVGSVVNGHPIVFHRISDIDSNSINRCHLLYIETEENIALKERLNRLSQKKILTVSNLANFCRQGGMICLVKKKGRIKVEINLNVARKAGFNISSNLLEVASIVNSQ
jgi:hypothetical protein